MDENDIVVDDRPKRFRDNVPKKTDKEKSSKKNEFDEELKYYFYRNDGKPLNREEYLIFLANKAWVPITISIEPSSKS